MRWRLDGIAEIGMGRIQTELVCAAGGSGALHAEDSGDARDTLDQFPQRLRPLLGIERAVVNRINDIVKVLWRPCHTDSNMRGWREKTVHFHCPCRHLVRNSRMAAQKPIDRPTNAASGSSATIGVFADQDPPGKPSKATSNLVLCYHGANAAFIRT
jgi:hypothetical protein